MRKSGNDPENCPSIYTIDTSRIPPEYLSSWIKDNTPYFASPAIGTRQDIDVLLIPEDDVATWLHENQLFIVYDVTYGCIECMHTIDDVDEIEIVELAPSLDTMTFFDLIKEIEDLGGDFQFPNYNGFLKISVDINQILTYSFVTEFNKDLNCFSIPFFHSILHNNSNVSTDAEIILKCPEDGRFEGKKITITVKTLQGFIKNYDFSQVPV